LEVIEGKGSVMIRIRARWRPILLVRDLGRPLNEMVDEIVADWAPRLITRHVESKGTECL
jgi:hypothetical protein